MIEIRNRTRGPLQLVVKARKNLPPGSSKGFSTLVLPGIGAGNETYLLEDERKTPQIDYLEKKLKMITTKHIPNEVSRGE